MARNGCPPAYLLEPVLLRLGRLTHLALQLLLLPTQGPNNYKDTKENVVI
jgi:hypothetical protein